MTAVQYVEAILENRWESSITDREVDVPQPEVYRESAESYRKINLDQNDAIILEDGGITNIEPQTFTWAQERLVSRVTVDIRTTGEAGSVAGRERLWGHRGTGTLGATESERYGGLVGEVKRICDEVRAGDEEFDLIQVTEENDLSGEMGGQVWRATVTVVLDTRANTIDPTP